MYIEKGSLMSGLEDLRNPFTTALLTSLLFSILALLTAIILIFLNENDYAVPHDYFGNGFTDHYLVRWGAFCFDLDISSSKMIA